jgi:hypothetical protein
MIFSAEISAERVVMVCNADVLVCGKPPFDTFLQFQFLGSLLQFCVSLQRYVRISWLFVLVQRYRTESCRLYDFVFTLLQSNLNLFNIY